MTTPPRPSSAALIRDVLIFSVKLFFDGVKDVVLVQFALTAAVWDLLFGKPGRPLLFYGVLKLGERFDLWLNLYGAAEAAEQMEDGLFGASRAGSPTLLGKLEELVRNGPEADAPEPVASK
jgi:hypothetical protein